MVAAIEQNPRTDTAPMRSSCLPSAWLQVASPVGGSTPQQVMWWPSWPEAAPVMVGGHDLSAQLTL